LGKNAGQTNQGLNAVALGEQAGNSNQGSNAVAIGYLAGQIGQHPNSIVINAQGTALNTTSTGTCFVSPIRTVSPPSSNYLTYDDTSKEVTKNPTLGEFIVFNSNKMYVMATDPASSYTIVTGDIWIDTSP
jgi:hypothetical protein